MPSRGPVSPRLKKKIGKATVQGTPHRSRDRTGYIPSHYLRGHRAKRKETDMSPSHLPLRLERDHRDTSSVLFFMKGETCTTLVRQHADAMVQWYIGRGGRVSFSSWSHERAGIAKYSLCGKGLETLRTFGAVCFLQENLTG